MPLSAFLSVGIRADVSVSDSEGRGVSLRSFAERLPRSRPRAELCLRPSARPSDDATAQGGLPHMQEEASEKIDAGPRAALAG